MNCADARCGVEFEASQATVAVTELGVIVACSGAHVHTGLACAVRARLRAEAASRLRAEQPRGPRGSAWRSRAGVDYGAFVMRPEDAVRIDPGAGS